MLRHNKKESAFPRRYRANSDGLRGRLKVEEARALLAVNQVMFAQFVYETTEEDAFPFEA